MQSLFEPLLPRERDKRGEHVVPCNERVRFNNLTGDTLKFKANKRTYIVMCHKGPERAQCVGQQEGEGLRSITCSVDVLLGIKILWLGTL
ncbi:hypothetical protein CFC21_099648 [Triticum aestivum]|uniref:Uncharacterized protein n=2 Tax=Triticum aestivum TaxID=4565 RepID=A0A3B6RPY9_WHEAT|nr:hypothetical protein CFC21_099648 [Triticum aestivum]